MRITQAKVNLEDYRKNLCKAAQAVGSLKTESSTKKETRSVIVTAINSLGKMNDELCRSMGGEVKTPRYNKPIAPAKIAGVLNADVIFAHATCSNVLRAVNEVGRKPVLLENNDHAVLSKVFTDAREAVLTNLAFAIEGLNLLISEDHAKSVAEVNAKDEEAAEKEAKEAAEKAAKEEEEKIAAEIAAEEEAEKAKAAEALKDSDPAYNPSI